MIRLGLIGCGEHAEGGHAVPLVRYQRLHPGEVELTAACDLNVKRAQTFCQKYGFLQAYGLMDEMLAKNALDGCIAVVPVERIPEVGIRLLERRIACVVEKPLGASLADVRTLLAAAHSTGTPNMVSVNRRFMPFLNRALEWSRTAGSLRYVRCLLARHARTEPEFLWGTAVHAVDTMRHLAGEVAATDIRLLQSAGGSAAWYTIDLRFSSGVSGRIDVVPTTGMLDETYELMGEGFRAQITCPFGPRRGWRGFRENRVEIEEYESAETPEDVLNGFYDETSCFIRTLASTQDLRPSIEDVFPSVELCLNMAKKINQQTESVAPVSH